MKRILKIFLLALIPCGCMHKENTLIRKFPDEELLWPVKTVHFDPLKTNIMTIDYATDGLWVCKLVHGGENCFAVINTDLDIIAKFGKEGRGPDEFNTPFFSGFNSLTGDSLSVNIRDWSMGRLYNVSVCLSDGGTSTSLLKDFGKPMRAVYPLGENSYLCNGDNNRYYFAGPDGKTEYLEGWDEEFNEAVENNEWFIPDNQTSQVLSENGSALYVYSLAFPIIYKHSIEDGRLMNKKILFHNQKQLIKEQISAYFQVAGFYNGHFIAFYREERAGDADKNRLLVFDRDLNPVIAYNVENMNDFAINSDSGLMMAVNYDEELIRYYDMSTIDDKL